ncbi:class A beta-lactamase [Bradyrhizobium sp. ISRA443]|uniref:class A beta-lactamase n=1 Tax=unclassified Bradyrhizobium TaxID=2631580 RepID=UPI00247B1504|nr:MULTISPECIES: class A beta-lactamase [unclassified Bradyrhizobium]WGR93854.1 class A beta-lactamase [Bradyrhizobium sp. ISRA435]WGR98471.1 class A beta-lactamase [Bradyrhizobium sp. ISRA436]WGS05360.1 class A beta-lactamase [Bradyrhizobium sp. ISRA437]WGS12246.1 class A beta-lactamase [Bradyrhizobium sp. ISRA443]
MLTRRTFGLRALGLAISFTLPRQSAAAGTDALTQRLQQELARIEQETGGRLGVAMLDTETGLRANLRGNERFPMCSTFKAMASAAVLHRVDRGQSSLDQHVQFEAKDLQPYSPVTKERVASGMTLAEIGEAAITQSDNTAGNMLLREIGGPVGLTSFFRSIGDNVSRLDRWEVALNEGVPGDPRDTTSPTAMLKNLRRVLLGETLSAGSRQTLTDWMTANKTGGARLRAGVPRDWRVADKTGTGERGTANDIGVFWPPGRKPIIVTVYLTGAKVDSAQSNEAIAKVARAVANASTGQTG